jgi:methylenetetrahydrofolate dehydrogenase (NADP+) / methenyltetrahydrofolate cyclohydrolase
VITRDRISAGSRAATAPTGRYQARILAGTQIADQMRESVASGVTELRQRFGFAPGVAVVLVGDDPPSRVYAGRIQRNASRVGLPSRLVELPADVGLARFRRELSILNADPLVGGVIVQMPLPDHLPLRDAITALDPAKDIDGIHPENAGLLELGYDAFYPSCAAAAIQILKRSGEPIAGKRAVVVGRSNVVGKPAQLLLLRENATVTVCHRQTRDLAAELRRAELVVTATGVPGLIRGDMLAAGAVVVDCGINVLDGQIVGDADFESVAAVAGAVTPVPGGVGPVTNAVLLEHLLQAARAQLGAAASTDAEPMPHAAASSAS